jgi:hypothetical protein
MKKKYYRHQSIAQRVFDIINDTEPYDSDATIAYPISERDIRLRDAARKRLQRIKIWQKKTFKRKRKK